MNVVDSFVILQRDNLEKEDKNAGKTQRRRQFRPGTVKVLENLAST